MKHTSFSTQRVAIDKYGSMVVEEPEMMPAYSTASECASQSGEGDENQLRFKRKRSRAWNKLETDLFYEVLGGTGTDFALMNDYIPQRSRLDIKRKFRCEQKADPERISEVLAYPSMLDEGLQERVDRLLERIPAEEDYLRGIAKRRRNVRKRRSRAAHGPTPSDEPIKEQTAHETTEMDDGADEEAAGWHSP